MMFTQHPTSANRQSIFFMTSLAGPCRQCWSTGASTTVINSCSGHSLLLKGCIWCTVSATFAIDSHDDIMMLTIQYPLTECHLRIWIWKQLWADHGTSRVAFRFKFWGDILLVDIGWSASCHHGSLAMANVVKVWNIYYKASPFESDHNCMGSSYSLFNNS